MYKVVRSRMEAVDLLTVLCNVLDCSGLMAANYSFNNGPPVTSLMSYCIASSLCLCYVSPIC